MSDAQDIIFRFLDHCKAELDKNAKWVKSLYKLGSKNSFGEWLIIVKPPDGNWSERGIDVRMRQEGLHWHIDIGGNAAITDENGSPTDIKRYQAVVAFAISSVLSMLDNRP